MSIEIMQNIAKGSITDVKKSPMKIFEKSKKLKKGIYILNRNDVVGVMMNQEHYESLLNRIEELEENVFEAEAARRLAIHDAQEKPKTYSIEEMEIDLSGVKYDENDDWE